MKSTIKVHDVVRNSIRMYFAPLIGAFKGVRKEMRRTERENAKRLHNDRAREHVKHA